MAWVFGEELPVECFGLLKAPLAVIPVMLTHADQLLRRRRRWYALYGAFGCLVLAAIAIQIFYRPWDVIWAVALRHIGIQT